MHQLKEKEQRNSHFGATWCLLYDLTEVQTKSAQRTAHKEVDISSIPPLLS